MAKKELTRDNHEVLIVCLACCGSGNKLPETKPPEKCRRCKGSGYEK
jgi:DnaJ-class molecular chaperone